MKITIGSTSPVKVGAARAVLSQLYTGLELASQAVPSGVPAQPQGHAETRAGALNRARGALRAGQGDLGIGFEGGVVETEHGWMTCAWCAVVDRAGRIGLGGGVSAMLPPAVASAVAAGGELGPAMDALTGAHDTKNGPGAVGILTGGLTDRQQAYEQILRLALAPFRRPDLYPLPADSATEQP